MEDWTGKKLMKDWTGKELINALYSYLNINEQQLTSHDNHSKSGFYDNHNISAKWFTNEYFSHEYKDKNPCPSLNNRLPKDLYDFEKLIKLIKQRLSDGTTLFDDYSFLIGNDEITADNIEEKLNTLIEYAYRTKVTVFDSPVLITPNEYKKTIDLPKKREELFKNIILHKKTLLYGCIGSGKTRLVQFLLKYYNLQDVCYIYMYDSLNDALNDAIKNIDLEKIDPYNNALLVIDNFKYDENDSVVLKKLMGLELSVILICNEYSTVKSFCSLVDPKIEIVEISDSDYPDELLEQMIAKKYKNLTREFLYYSGRNPLMISFITSSLSKANSCEDVFKTLDSLIPKGAKLKGFRSKYSNELNDAGTKLLTGHIKSIYEHKINILKKSEYNTKLKVLFAIACFGWNNIPRSFVNDIIKLLEIKNDPSELIDELIGDKYLHSETDDYISISPILGNVLFSQYNDFSENKLFTENKLLTENKLFTEKNFVSLYKALNEYLKSHHLLFIKDYLLFSSISIFIERTYRFIAPSDNSSKKTDRVKRAYDFVYSTCVESFHFCCRNGAFYDAEKILMSLRHLEDYRPNSSGKVYASNTYTIFDHKLLELMRTLSVDMVYGSVSPNKSIVDLIENLTKDLNQYGANGINPKEISEFISWRKKTFEELGLYIAIDKTILSIVSLPYDHNISINKILDFYNIAVVSVFKKISFKVEGNDSTGYDYSFDPDVYTTIIFEYLNSFFNCSFKNIETPKNYTKLEPLDDYIYRLSIWISLKTISIITSKESLDIKLQLFESDLLPSLSILVSILKDRLTIIPVYLMIPFIRVIQSLGIAIPFINMNTKKEEDIHFPISEEDIGTICQKCYIDYKPFCANVIYASSDINRYLATSKKAPQAE